ncbi:DUF4359 domain-containing protein [Gloeothece verrucosa]|uniref:DUF4359 domain-containing protein n=1 Tax=Gloeothece verrucosa (strain PCC 7822) TaxID=497965 RepID=E0U7R5_GLOV7|nr:DUF4359 domain-containing protein [Gloeothece verrucosa]ADN14877.1 conserved hypothetical protein [Gloeothece verrucosa PCC 7822]
MKGNLIIGGIVLAVVGIVMGVTNPKPSAYKEYISEKLLLEGEKALCKQTEVCHDQSTPAILNPLIKRVKDKIAKPAIEKVIEETTTRQNLIFFSIYTTEISDIETIKTLGAFNYFLTYSS